MTFWEAYCDSGIRGGYKRLLCAEGYLVRDAEDIMDKFFVYVTRMKGTCFASELNAINDRTEFLNKLNEIFSVKWKDHIKDSYSIMHSHFVAYLDYLRIAQASRGEYINAEEKNAIEQAGFQFPAEKLSDLESRYVKDGKITALINPTLICLIRKQYREQGSQRKSIGLLCKNYYSKVLPKMTATDCLKLIDDIWASKDRVRAAGHDRKLKITFPDMTVTELSMTDGLKAMALYFGPDKIKAKKIALRGRNLVTNVLPLSGKEDYISIDETYYMNTVGNYKDKLNAANTINAMFNRPLKIELI